MKSGIYEIKNKINNKIYIGSSININYRIKRHFKDLEKGTHHSRFLQRSYDKYGSEAFSFRTVELAPKEKLLSVEQSYLDKLKPSYNNSKVAGNTSGAKHSAKTIKANKERNTGFGNGNSKITPDMLADILIMREKKSVSAIAKIYKVNRSTIDRVIKRHTTLTFDKIYDQAARKKISDTNKGSATTSIPVAQINAYGHIIETFPSITAAAKSVDRGVSAMRASILTKGRCAGKLFIFTNQTR